MGKAKKKTSTTIGVMLIIAIIILLFYYYWSNRTTPIDTSSDHQSEVEKLISKDLELYYPETPKEVAKLYASMTKNIYGDLKDEEVKALALKVRELYDEKFLEENPEDAYLNDLYSDIAKWKDKKRTILSFVIVNEDMDEENEIDGVKYATKSVSFTIQEDVRFAEIRELFLRQDENKKWKIFGWRYVSEEEDK